MNLRRLSTLIILVLAVGCQPLQPAALVVLLPTPTPQPAAEARPTHTPRPIQAAPSAASPSASPTVPPPPTTAALPPTVTIGASPAPALEGTPIGTAVPTLSPAGSTFVIGQSAQGRDILAWRFGTGSKIVLLVGGVHTGFESNTVLLVNELVRHFEGTPAEVLPEITLVLIPALNPDGLVLGRQTAGRFNGNTVDLNRNWGCEWSEKAYWRDRLVDPGERPFSEPETRALAEWIRANRPAAAIFFHSAAAGVFAGACEGEGVSAGLAAVLGQATSYAYGQPFSAYPVTGTAASWVDGLGIPAVDLELSGTRDSEFVRNRRGILAVQCWLTDPAQIPSIPICSA